MRRPESCMTMTELRKEIDSLDREIVGKLALRTKYIDRAAELKPGEGMQARVDERIAEVVANVRGKALAERLDQGLIQDIWIQLIEWSIAREETKMATEK